MTKIRTETVKILTRTLAFTASLAMPACASRPPSPDAPPPPPPTTSNIEKIVAEIEQGGLYQSRHVGSGGNLSEQYARFERLLAIATGKQMVELTHHSSGVVRAYALKGVLIKFELQQLGVNFEQLASDHLHDDEIIETQHGCEITQMRVSEFYLQELFWFLEEKSPDSLRKINLEVLRARIDLDYASTILRRQPTDWAYYPYIAKLARDGNVDAMVALSRYKLETDLALVEQLENLNEDRFLQVIINFTKPRYKPFLEKYAGNVLSTDESPRVDTDAFFQAVAAYQDDFAIKIFNRTLALQPKTDEREYSVDSMFKAVKEYKNGTYDQLFLRLWAEESLVDLGMVEYLYAKYPEDSYKKIQLTLENPVEFNDRREEIEAMIRIAADVDREDTIAKMVGQITKVDVSLFEVYAKLSCVYKDKRLKGALEKRLANNDHWLVEKAAKQALSCY